MKRRREYMQRSGMRFDRRRTKEPAGNFIGGPITDTVSVTASIYRTVTSSYSTTPIAQHDDTFSANQFILGASSLGRIGGLAYYTTGSVPSWTNRHLGKNSGFVITALSSSDHESQVLGMRRSGSERLEAGSGSAESSTYYTRSEGYRYVTVKKTASYLDTARLPATVDGFTPVYFDAAKGTDITTVTGTLSYLTPALMASVGSAHARSTIAGGCLIPIEVPYSGKIVDIKVWIELTQVSGSGLGAVSAEPGIYPLGGLVISLRSPNVKWGNAIPIRNDSDLKKVFTTNLSDFSSYGTLGMLGQSLFGPDYISPFYQNSFILWEGPSVFGETSQGPWDTDIEFPGGAQYVTSKYPSWQRDRSMRTVFSDGAVIPNPRHHIANSNPSSNYNGSPNSYFEINNAYGMDVPWTSQTEISGANTRAAAGSPPAGWLSGPGGVNAVNEWPTTGVNYGADCIRPLYPLLDPIYQRKRYGTDITRRGEATGTVFNTDEWTGFRPGLRGTEVSGTWYLIVGDNRSVLDDVSSDAYTPTYFKQVRLEFVLSSDVQSKPHDVRRDSSRYKTKKSSDAELIVSLSGSDSLWDSIGGWDAYNSDTYLLQNDNSSPWEIGRTIGIIELTGNLSTTQDFALAYRLAGTIADISGSNPGWLLNNRFGMPVITVASASLAEPDSSDIVSINPQQLLTVRAVVDGTKRISDAAQDANPAISRASYTAIITSGST